MNSLLHPTIPDLINFFEVATLIVVLAVLEFKVVKKRILMSKLTKYLVLLCSLQIVILFVDAAYFAYTTWHVTYGRFLFPPHSEYYLRQLSPSVSSLVSGFVSSGVVLVFTSILIKKKSPQIDALDAMLLVVGTLAVGWPGVLLFLAIVMVLSIFGLVIQILLKKKSVSDRLVITPYIMPAAIVTLMIKTPLLAITHLDKIRF